ncbi:MAG: hypothetical protein IPF96_02185 [Rhodobacter sp.]|nr:hypothetical protein [Rhodobacter sp.]
MLDRSRKGAALVFASGRRATTTTRDLDATMTTMMMIATTAMTTIAAVVRATPAPRPLHAAAQTACSATGRRRGVKVN